jgi:pimeloyl-ACP methyl ester carboxylesterase
MRSGAVAILLALEVPRRIRTLSLFEPVLFPLLYEAAEDSGREVWLLRTDVRRLVKRHRCREAAERFVDYWNGTGAFRSMAEREQEAVTRMVPKVASEFAALMSSPIAESDLRELRVPTLLSMASARRLPPGTSAACWREFCRAGNSSASRVSGTWGRWKTRSSASAHPGGCR